MTRCFVGFEFEPESLAYLRERVEPAHRLLAEEQGWPVRLVRPENWHVTLLFFAGLETRARREVWAEVEAAARSGVWSGLAFEWRGLAVWPSTRRPSLVCLEAAPFPGTSAWPLPVEREPFSHARIENYLSFRPHTTLMRFRRGKKGRSQGAVGREWRDLGNRLPAFEPERIGFDRVSMFLSTLTHEQPIYPREFTASLR